MKTHPSRRGFTVVEVMLFLAVTSVMAVGILAGSSIAIDRQRYRDSVYSLKGLMQEQYSQINNVVNTGNQNRRSPQCTGDASAITLDDSIDQVRGTSQCLILGRFVLVEPQKVTTYNVIGFRSGNTNGANDIATLQQFAFSLESAEETEVAWGAQIVTPGATPLLLTASVLIVKSPLSGLTMTFTRTGNYTSNPKSIVNSTYMSSPLLLCVDSRGAVLHSRRAVKINAYAAGQSAVEIPIEADNVCGA